MRLGMNNLPQFAAVAIVFFAIGLLIGFWVSKRRAKGLGNEPAVVVSKNLMQPVPVSEPEKTTDVQSKLDQVSAGISFLVNHFKIRTDISEYGSLISDAYDNFMAGVNNEFEILEQRKIEGPEYHFRSNMLLFSLMMARVYMGLYAPEASLRKLEGYIERAKRLV